MYRSWAIPNIEISFFVRSPLIICCMSQSSEKFSGWCKHMDRCQAIQWSQRLYSLIEATLYFDALSTDQQHNMQPFCETSTHYHAMRTWPGRRHPWDETQPRNNWRVRGMRMAGISIRAECAGHCSLGGSPNRIRHKLYGWAYLLRLWAPR